MFKKSILTLSILLAIQGCSQENNETILECDLDGNCEKIIKIKEKKEEPVSQNNDSKKDQKSVKNITNNEDEIYEAEPLPNVNFDYNLTEKTTEPDNAKQKKPVDKIKELKVIVKSGDSFLKILNENNIPSQFFYNLKKEQQDELVSINIGNEIVFHYDEENKIVKEVRRVISNTLSISLILDEETDKYKIVENKEKLKKTLKLYEVKINNSLYVDGKKVGLTNNIIANIQNTLDGRFSFVRDMRKGDVIKIVSEENIYEGERVGKQKIVGIVVNSSRRGKIFSFRHKFEDGDVGFYDEKGESSESGFIRHPIQTYKRISSRFNPRRKHPITGRVRPHNGTDYAASTGTPILAASDGIVAMAKYNGGYGNVVYINHKDSIQTRYAHMHGISVKRGQRVSKGQIIGTVGTTGASTGPHLHYEFWKNRVAYDSLKIRLPKGDGLQGKELEKFKANKSNIMAILGY